MAGFRLPLALALGACVLISSPVGTRADGANPVGKVMQLLDEMKAKVEAEGAEATADFEEFAKWCDDEADDKDHAVKSAKAEIEDLDATIAQSTATIDNLGTRIQELSMKISDTDKELADATKARERGHETFAAAEEELVNTVETLAHDAELIKNQMTAGFLQIDSSKRATKLKLMMDSMQRIVESGWVSSEAKAKVQAFLQTKTQAQEDAEALTLQQPAAYESSSGGIVDAINGMEEKADDSLNEERKQEMKDQNAFELLKMALENELEDLKDQMSKATSRKQFTEMELAEAQKSHAGTSKGLADDEKYLADLRHDCQAKAADYEEDYKDRANELAALAKAKDIMSSKFSLLQTSVTTQSLSKMKRFEDNKQAALQLIHKLGKKLGSTLLVSLSYRALADPFVKVKGMIEEMINKLLQEASEEADHKSFCDRELGQTETSKEEKSEKLQTTNSRIETGNSQSTKLEEQIKELTEEISNIDSAMAEATKLRQKEKAVYEKAAKDYSESQQACAAAIEVLRNYYEGGSFFLQLKATTASKSKSKMRMRTRETSEMTQSSGDGGGIIGMLEVAESDFSNLLVEAKTAEDNAEAEFDKMAQENKVLKATKNAGIKGATTQLASVATSLESYGEDKDGLTKELNAVSEYLDKLKPQCEYQVPSYEERAARREKEIQGLKDALSVLEGDGVPTLSFVQKSATIQRV